MDVVGGGVLVAVAAALWLAYLMPNWLRRRQYNATEQNAVRLQQTLRILAETAETPEAVRLEATAREVVAQQRILAAQKQTAKLEAETARLAAEAAEQLALADRRAAAEAVAAARSRATQLTVTEPIAIIRADASGNAAAGTGVAAGVGTGADDPVARAARRRLRRARALSSLVLLLSITTVVVGLVGLAFGGTPLLAAVGAIGAVVAFASLAVLAGRRTTAVRSFAATPVVARPTAPEFEPIDVVADAEAVEGWTPQPLPKPLHLSRGTIAATAMASIEAAAELQRAAAGAAIAARAERLVPEVPAIRRAAAARADDVAAAAAKPAEGAPANPYAAMGRVEASGPAFDDLDTVLRRRRAV